MSIYFGFIYGLLIIELAIFSILIVPLPYRLSKLKKHFIKVVNYVIQGNETLKITSRSVVVFILIFFIDCINKLNKLQKIIQILSLSTSPNSLLKGHIGGSSEYMNMPKSELYMTKFYSQRNMYLTGFTLFLSLAILRMNSITMKLLELRSTTSKQLSEIGECADDDLKIQERLKSLDDMIDNLHEKNKTTTTD